MSRLVLEADLNVKNVNLPKSIEGMFGGTGGSSSGQSSGSNPIADILEEKNHDTMAKYLRALTGDTSQLSDGAQGEVKLTKFIGEQFNKISEIMTKGVGMAFDVVENIYKELKKSSPLLQTLETLFNLAMQLFFMPLGNKLAEVLLPAVVNLVETAAKLWDELGDGNLDQIFSRAIEYGVKALSSFFKSIGKSLQDQGGLLGSIGDIMGSIGNFIEHGLVNVIEALLNVTKFIVDNLKLIITAIAAFKAASIATNILTARAIITGNTMAFGTSVGVVGGLALLGGASAYVGSSALGLADGGEVKHTPGGRLVMVAENEDEMIIPKSKANMGGNVINNFYGYTSQDIEDRINRSVSEKISISRIKGGI